MLYIFYSVNKPRWIVFQLFTAEPYSSVGSVADLWTGGRWFDPLLGPIFFPWIDDNHWDRIYSSLTSFRCFENGYVGKEPVAWKEYCAEYWLKELQETAAWMGALAAAI